MKSDLRTALALLALLVFAALLNGLVLPVAGRNVRPEHVAAPLVFTWLAIRGIRRRERVIRLDAFSFLAGGWVLVNALSSWLYAPQPSESFVHVVRLGLLVVIFLSVANLPLRDASGWTGALRIWLGLGALELAYGLVTWALAGYGNVWLPGAYYEPAIAGIGIQGTQLERNFFGIIAGTLLAALSYLLLAQRATNRAVVARSSVLGVATAVAGCAVILALTRSAWIAVVSVAPLAYLIFDRRRPANADPALLRAVFAVPLLCAVLIVLLQLLPSPATSPSQAAGRSVQAGRPAQVLPRKPGSAGPPVNVVRDRLRTFVRLESDFTAGTRIQDARWALNDWRASPFLGRGTGSFLQIHGIRVGTEAWISNLILHTLVDTGLVGLAIQLCLIGLVGIRAWQAALRTGEPALTSGLKALTLGLLVMLIAYQFTDGTWLAVFWVHLGLMVNGLYRVREERPALAGTRS